MPFLYHAIKISISFISSFFLLLPRIVERTMFGIENGKEKVIERKYSDIKKADAEIKKVKQFNHAELQASARSLGAQSIVLAKNDNSTLPIEIPTSIAVIGAHARFGRALNKVPAPCCCWARTGQLLPPRTP